MKVAKIYLRSSSSIKAMVHKVEYGFVQSKSDHTMFTKGSSSSFLGLLVYVDDIIIAGPSTTLIQELKYALQCQFKLKDLIDFKYFNGLEIARSSQDMISNM